MYFPSFKYITLQNLNHQIADVWYIFNLYIIYHLAHSKYRVSFTEIKDRNKGIFFPNLKFLFVSSSIQPFVLSLIMSELIKIGRLTDQWKKNRDLSTCPLPIPDPHPHRRRRVYLIDLSIGRFDVSVGVQAGIGSIPFPF